MLANPLKVLMIEDDPRCVELVKIILADFNEIKLDSSSTLEKGMALLETGNYDAVLLDLGLPDSRGINTLLALLIKYPACPLIVLTGYDESELGLLAVRAGAQDFFSKKDLDGPLIAHSLHYSVERQKKIVRLEQNRHEIERLRGLLPICMNCRNIRDDKGYWTQLEQYLSERSSVRFSHGICPACLDKASNSSHITAGK